MNKICYVIELLTKSKWLNYVVLVDNTLWLRYKNRLWLHTENEKRENREEEKRNELEANKTFGLL